MEYYTQNAIYIGHSHLLTNKSIIISQIFLDADWIFSFTVPALLLLLFSLSTSFRVSTEVLLEAVGSSFKSTTASSVGFSAGGSVV